MAEKSSRTLDNISNGNSSPEPDTPQEYVSRISSDQFSSWYRERRYRQNIEQGTPYFNNPSVPKPAQHSPSRLLKCHRRVYYEIHNAPAEVSKPIGIFWFGSSFETDISVPFLRSVTEENHYVRNSIWVDFKIEVDSGEVRFRGETDPVIVDEESRPVLLTEIKTTSSIQHMDKPSPHHRAQVHAYLYGLSERYETEYLDAVILYFTRDDFAFRQFHVRFDSKFWLEEVLTWATEDSGFRADGILPPATPEREWECEFCPYSHRCGKRDSPFSDEEPTGLLPLTKYPPERLEEYLAAYPTAKLTPTLAHCYPELAAEHGSYDWRCSACSAEFPVETTSWEGDLDQLPICADCAANAVYAPLVDPDPNGQSIVEGGESNVE
ncbi:PD-(D/E)XK nuclease family protein [Haloferax sp. YSSS75]|uniref:CRISPR-associated protein Cas4 n=1 Tax=Haloferax sp. YSSS75 TaxID=3388564 RepID=UPI00398D4730